jgi:MFS family permease
LYVTYTFSALFFAKFSLRVWGPKPCIMIGLRCLLFYIVSFLFVVIFRKTKWIFLLGSFVGGIGAGILWTAQSTYYRYISMIRPYDVYDITLCVSMIQPYGVNDITLCVSII